MVYLPRARKHGLSAVARGCLQRALKLYGVHIGLTFAALFIFARASGVSGVDDLIAAHGRSFVFGSPLTGVVGLALLSHQLGYFNILPLYVVLMLWAPLALAMAMRNRRRSPSRRRSASMPPRACSSLTCRTGPKPAAGSSIRSLGSSCSRSGSSAPSSGATGRRARRPGLVALSLGAIAMSAIVTTSAAGLAPGLRDAASAHLDLAKQDLGLARLAHFAALAYLAAVVPGLPRLADGAAGRAVQSLGRNGLAVFAAGSCSARWGRRR